MDYIRAVAELIKGEPNTYCIRTFGCQQNEHDSEKIAGILEEMCFSPVEKPEASRLVVFNTCCVRENAEQKIFGHLGQLKKLKEENPYMLIAVCGCMMQQPHIVEEIKRSYRHVDIIFGTSALHLFPKLIFNALIKDRLTSDTQHNPLTQQDADAYLDADTRPDAETIQIKPVRKDSLKAWVSIMTGCDNYCSYCIVPYVRGREQSRGKNKILGEIKALSLDGYKEIVLLGQNVNSYRDGNTGFADLLYEVNEIPGIERIRFVTSHPKDFTYEIAKAMKDCGKVCEHLHLPLQSGSNRVLKMMNRKYTREEYLEKVAMLKSVIPGIALSTDIITSFPGESAEDFEDTLDMLERVRYDSAFTFIYSKRKGTPAENLPGQIDRKIAQERFARLLDVQNRISMEISRSYIGRTVEVLVEGRSKTRSDIMTGRTRTNKVVNFPGDIGLTGKTVGIRISEAYTWHLEGSL